MAQWTKRFNLDGKRILVTGATKGICFETCQVLADTGADAGASPSQPTLPPSMGANSRSNRPQ
jgi:hypothetical protein